MANIRVAVAARNAMLEALLARLDLGAGPATLKLYTGTQPATGDTALSGNTLLGTLTFANPAGDVDAGTLTFDVITEDSSADNDGDATWGRLQDSDGNNVLDGNVSETDGLFMINEATIAAGGPIRVESFTISLPADITF